MIAISNLSFVKSYVTITKQLLDTKQINVSWKKVSRRLNEVGWLNAKLPQRRPHIAD